MQLGLLGGLNSRLLFWKRPKNTTPTNFTFQNKLWGLCPTPLLMKLFSRNAEKRNAGECAEWVIETEYYR
jgi:hypothetical protein